MAEKRVSVPPYAGSGDGWGGSLPLRHDYPTEIVLDLGGRLFVTPTFLLRVRTFVDWHTAEGRTVKVVTPKDVNVSRYLARMHIGEDLPAKTFDKLPAVREADRRDVLIPIKRLCKLPEVDELADAVSRL